MALDSLVLVESADAVRRISVLLDFEMGLLVLEVSTLESVESTSASEGMVLVETSSKETAMVIHGSKSAWYPLRWYLDVPFQLRE